MRKMHDETVDAIKCKHYVFARSHCRLVELLKFFG